MRSITVFIALAYLAFMPSCNNSDQGRANGQEHIEPYGGVRKSPP
ncbi:MAG: hypothetical protein U5K32_04180 [Bacteroidales bacterium]|nr:hypothetical protein [Bacteroidales bacterium]